MINRNFSFITQVNSRIKIQYKIMILLITISVFSVVSVGGIAYYMSSQNITFLIENALENSTRNMVQQITEIMSFLNTKVFDSRLKMILLSEINSFNKQNIDASIYMVDLSGNTLNWRQDEENIDNIYDFYPNDFVSHILETKSGVEEIRVGKENIMVSYGHIPGKEHTL